jgi:zinc transporter ZupT
MLWQKWLVVLGGVITAFGVLLALFNGTPLFDIFNQQINPVFWKTPDAINSAREFQQWVYGVLGATMAGWGVFVTFIAHVPFKRKEKWAWTCLTTGVLVWFCLDTAISLQFRVYFNVAFNTAFLVAALVPLGFSRKDFSQ